MAPRKQRLRAKQEKKQPREGAEVGRTACMAQGRPHLAGVSSTILMLCRCHATCLASCARHTWDESITCVEALCHLRNSKGTRHLCSQRESSNHHCLYRRDKDANLEGHNRGRYAAAIMKRGLHQQARSRQRHLVQSACLLPRSLLYPLSHELCSHMLSEAVPPCLSSMAVWQPLHNDIAPATRVSQQSHELAALWSDRDLSVSVGSGADFVRTSRIACRIGQS